MSAGRGSGKNSLKRRARFGAGEEGNEVASLACKCQDSPDVASHMVASHTHSSKASECRPQSK